MVFIWGLGCVELETECILKKAFFTHRSNPPLRLVVYLLTSIGYDVRIDHFGTFANAGESDDTTETGCEIGYDGEGGEALELTGFTL